MEMDKKQLLDSEAVEWNNDIELTLRRFPIMLRSNEWTTGTNYHHQPGLEIHMTQAGEGTMVVGREILRQTPRSVLVFRATTPHQMISGATYKRSVICLYFDEGEQDALPALHRLLDFSWVPEDACLSFSLTPRQFQRMEELCLLLRRELEEREPGWERMALSCVLQGTVLLQRSKAEAEEGASAPFGSKAGELVKQCADYVCANLGEALTLKSVARRFAVSEAYLTRCFTKEMNISFYQYVLLQRVAEGKRLLREASDVSIAEIAYTIGFPSASHFSRHFKSLTEETPSAYRARALTGR